MASMGAGNRENPAPPAGNRRPGEFPATQQTLAKKNDHQKEGQGKDHLAHARDTGDGKAQDHLRLLHDPQPLARRREQAGRQHRPGGGAQSPHHNNDQEIKGEKKREEVGGDGGDEMRQESPAYPKKKELTT